MTLRDAVQALTKAEVARLEWDFEQGNPSFVNVKGWEGFVVGVHLEKVDRLEQVEVSGKWSTAKKKPKEEM